MQYSIIPLSQVKQNSNFRFDAEYLERKLEKIKHQKLKSIFYPIKNGFDLQDIAKAFETWAKEQGLSFWK